MMIKLNSGTFFTIILFGQILRITNTFALDDILKAKYFICCKQSILACWHGLIKNTFQYSQSQYSIFQYSIVTDLQCEALVILIEDCEKQLNKFHAKKAGKRF